MGTMTVVRIDEVPSAAMSNPILIGNVSIQRLIDREVEGNGGEQCHVAMINFAAGSGNEWHVHTTAQVLIVTAGTGIVATRDETATVTTGAVIFIPPGVAHRHGATPDSAFSHLSVTWAAAQTAAAPAS